MPGLSVYAATKAAVVSLTTSVAAETPRNVRVHAVCPDGVDTEMVAVMKADGLARALVHSGGGLLTADAGRRRGAVALIGSSRVVRTLPGWRGGLVRTTALAPSVAMKGAARSSGPGPTGDEQARRRHAVRTNVPLMLDSFEHLF